jgi:hypothetical protein
VTAPMVPIDELFDGFDAARELFEAVRTAVDASGAHEMRVTRSEMAFAEPHPGRFLHHLELRSPVQIDYEVAAWLREAWEAPG